MADGNIEIGLKIDTKTGLVQLKDFEQKANNAGKKTGKGFSDGFKSSLGGFFSTATKVGAVLTGVFSALATKGAFDAAKSIEKIETQFEVLTGSVAGAQKQVEDLVKFAASTPFQLQGLSDTAAGLLSFGIAEDQVIDKLKVLGDVAAGSGKDIKEIGLIFGQVKAAGKLTGERLLQLQERAIPIGPALAKTFGVAEESVKDLVSSGKVGFAQFEQALTSITEKGGLFEGATLKQSKTLGGLVSTLKDNIFALQVAIGKALGPTFKAVTAEAITLFQNLTKQFNENKTQILNGLFDFGRGIVTYVIAPLELLTSIAQNTFNGVGALLDVAVGYIFSKLGTVGLFFENLGIKNKLTEELIGAGEAGAEAMETGFAEFRDIKKDVLNFDVSDKLDQFVVKMQDTATAVEAPLKKIEKKINKTVKTVEKGIKGTGKAIADAVNNAMVKTTSLGIQEMTKSLVLGQGSFGDFAKSVFKTLGSIATQLGETLLLAGLGIESLKSLGGAAAIAAGAGLIALGTILSSLGGGGGQASAAAPTGGGVASGLTGEDTAITEQTEEEERTAQQTVQLVVQGDILDSEDTGRRMLELLNENFERQGSVITGANFA